MPKNLTYDNARACCVPYDSPPPGLVKQIRRLAVENRPEACLGCGFEHGCSLHGCAVLKKVCQMLDPKGGSVMGMTNILLGLIAYAAVIVTVVLAYAAGRLDGRREGQRQQHTRTGAPIPMEHTHGGDADDL